MKSALFFLLSFLPILSLAQQHMEITGGLSSSRLYVENIDNSKYDGVDGSPYTNSEFTPAKINDIEKTQFIRFNIFDHTVEVQTDDKKIVLLNLENNLEIQLLDGSDKKYRTATYSNEGKKKKSFFELIKDGQNYSMYKQERKTYREEQEAEAFKEKQPAKFMDQSPVLYISDSDSSDLVKIPKKKKKFISLFAENGKSVEKFMKQEKLNFKDKDDLIQIFDFVHTDNK